MLDYKNSNLVLDAFHSKEGTISWKCPSNIALVKYWGKHGIQLPKNPSISLTLDKAHTKTKMAYSPKEQNDVEIDLDFYFEGKHNEAFASKIRKFLLGISDIFPFIQQLKFVIHSENSFPHSSGIASSASSMGALAMCLCSLEKELFGTLTDDLEFRKKASFVSRLGSGSACRSIYASAGLWGGDDSIPNSSDLFAIPYEDKVHEVFHTFHDDILIVSQGEKAVSSRAGHALMNGNDYAAPRYKQAKDRIHRLLIAMKTGDLETFGTITENEALTLHALMMTSNPSFILMKPNTLEMIDRIRKYRLETKLPVYFTLDAGPNIHLLYPDSIATEIAAFVKSELIPLCENGVMIADKVGKGPVRY